MLHGRSVLCGFLLILLVSPLSCERRGDYLQPTTPSSSCEGVSFYLHYLREDNAHFFEITIVGNRFIYREAGTDLDCATLDERCWSPDGIATSEVTLTDEEVQALVDEFSRIDLENLSPCDICEPLLDNRHFVFEMRSSSINHRSEHRLSRGQQPLRAFESITTSLFDVVRSRVG